MSERKNLPAKADIRSVTVQITKPTSLVARGLLSLQQDERYRRARAIVDKTHPRFGGKWRIEESAEIFEAFQTLCQLTDEGYGKAYYPLARVYSFIYD